MSRTSESCRWVIYLLIKIIYKFTTFSPFQSNFEGHLRTLSEMICDGNTVARVDCLIKEAKMFSKLVKTDLDRAEEVISCGRQLIQKAACPKEVVQPKCDELSRIMSLITDRLSKRHEILLKSRELMDRVEKVRSIYSCNTFPSQ